MAVEHSMSIPVAEILRMMTGSAVEPAPNLSSRRADCRRSPLGAESAKWATRDRIALSIRAHYRREKLNKLLCPPRWAAVGRARPEANSLEKIASFDRLGVKRRSEERIPLRPIMRGLTTLAGGSWILENSGNHGFRRASPVRKRHSMSPLEPGAIQPRVCGPSGGGRIIGRGDVPDPRPRSAVSG